MREGELVTPRVSVLVGAVLAEHGVPREKLERPWKEPARERWARRRLQEEVTEVHVP